MIITTAKNWAYDNAIAMKCTKECFCSNKCEKCDNVSNG